MQILHSEAYQNEAMEKPLQISQNIESVAAQSSDSSEDVLNAENVQNYINDGDIKDPQTPAAYYGDESSVSQNAISETQGEVQYYGDQNYQDQPYYYDQNNYQNQVSFNFQIKNTTINL